MKILGGFIVLVFIASCQLKGQDSRSSYIPFKKFKGDITRYLDYFFKNDDTVKYEGGKAIIFFNNLQVMPNEYGYYEANDTASSLLKFVFYKKNGLADERPPNDGIYAFRIRLKKSLLKSDIEKFEAENGKKWTKKHAAFFGNLIIASKIYSSGKSFSIGTGLLPYKALSEFDNNAIQYLKYNFLDNQLRYEVGTLNELLNNLELQPIGYKYVVASFDKRRSYKISLIFNQKNDITAKKPIKSWKSTLTIEFKNPVLVADIKKLNKENGRKWTKQHAALFGPQLIDEISLVSSR